MYVQVNPLQAFDATNKGKSKDIHLENIDLSFGSLRILNGANLTLAYGRRYGIIGRNGARASLLLKPSARHPVDRYWQIDFATSSLRPRGGHSVRSASRLYVQRMRLGRTAPTSRSYTSSKRSTATTPLPSRLSSTPTSGENACSPRRRSS